MKSRCNCSGWMENYCLNTLGPGTEYRKDWLYDKPNLPVIAVATLTNLDDSDNTNNEISFILKDYGLPQSAAKNCIHTSKHLANHFSNQIYQIIDGQFSSLLLHGANNKNLNVILDKNTGQMIFELVSIEGQTESVSVYVPLCKDRALSFVQQIHKLCQEDINQNA